LEVQIITVKSYNGKMVQIPEEGKEVLKEITKEKDKEGIDYNE
jgi:hypothetical protein